MYLQSEYTVLIPEKNIGLANWDRKVVAGKMLVGPQVGIGGSSSLGEDDLVSRACDWQLMTYDTSVW